MGRRRAVALVLVHLLVGLHVVHYLATGSTLSPLEPSEAGHSIRSGAINAGAVFLCVLLLSTLIFGRFFCGWACHVVAYQDLARWLLVKIGLRPRPVRARLLMFVPLFAVYWLYVHPLIARWRSDRADAGLSFHLTTDDFWATFPGPTISVLTFLLCGFIVVWFLGAKGFCTYGCPYGALFGLTDRLARGRIRVNEDCTQSGQCTRTCSSNVDVAAEVAQFGMVVDPGCMKCMDCVAGCPNDALSFGFGASPDRSKKPDAREKRRFDLSWGEEIALAAIFAITFWIYFNLYRTIPFLMAIGICIMCAYVLLVFARLLYASGASLQQLTLKRDGRWTGAGRAFAVAALLLLAFTVHSGVVQWHTKRANTAFGRAQLARFEGRGADLASGAAAASGHLDVSERWGLFRTRGSGRMRGELHRWRGEHDRALASFDDELAHFARNPKVPMFRALALLELERYDEARRGLARAFDGRAPPRDRFFQLEWELERMSGVAMPKTRLRELTAVRLDMLRLAVEKHAGDGELALKLCRLLAGEAIPEMRDRAEALRVAESAAEAGGRGHADLLAMLAWLYDDAGRHDEAVQAASDSVQVASEQGLEKMAAEMTAALAAYRRRAEESGSSAEPAP